MRARTLLIGGVVIAAAVVALRRDGFDALVSKVVGKAKDVTTTAQPPSERRPETSEKPDGTATSLGVLRQH